jgi:hypothetical protein
MVVLSGIDLNPRSAIEAVAATPTGTVIAWETGDVFDQAPEPKPDFVVSSQFAHHLTDDQVVAFLLWLEQQPTRLVHRRPALPHAAILRLSPPLPRRGLGQRAKNPGTLGCLPWRTITSQDETRAPRNRQRSARASLFTFDAGSMHA